MTNRTNNIIKLSIVLGLGFAIPMLIFFLGNILYKSIPSIIINFLILFMFGPTMVAYTILIFTKYSIDLIEAGIYRGQKKYQKAIECYKATLVELKEYNPTFFQRKWAKRTLLRIIYSSIAYCYFKTNDIAKSNDCIKEASKYVKENKREKFILHMNKNFSFTSKIDELLVPIEVLFFCTIYVFLFANIKSPALIIFSAALIFSLIYFLYEKNYNNLSNISKFLLILAYTFAFGLIQYTIFMFHSYPTIVNTSSYQKAREISDFIAKRYGAFGEINCLTKDSNSIVLHTYSHKKFDKIALAIAESELYDDSVKIGVYYRYSDDPKIARKRLEKVFNDRIKLINGVISVDTQVKFYEENGKPNPDKTELEINIITDKNTDKNNINTIVNRFIPIEANKKSIKISIIQ